MRYYNKFNKSINEPGRWVRLGACALILGASSLLGRLRASPSEGTVCGPKDITKGPAN